LDQEQNEKKKYFFSAFPELKKFTGLKRLGSGQAETTFLETEILLSIFFSFGNILLVRRGIKTKKLYFRQYFI